MGFFQWLKAKTQSMEDINREDLAEDFPSPDGTAKVRDPYLEHAWVNIAVGLLMRNVGRAHFVIENNGKKTEDSKAAKLFREPNPRMTCFDLWKETAAWWSLEGEAFWYFGEEYSAGLPTEIYVLNPRHMSALINDGTVTRWIYSGSDGESFTILPDEIVHFREWNPWNQYRGVCPLVSLGMEIEQDILAGKANSDLLKEGGIPKGLLKTDQIIRDEEADQIEKRWEAKYGRGSKRKVAVIGKGTSYQPLTLSPDVMKLYDIKKWNLYTILAKYGIPPRVANIQDVRSSLSGTDTREQHAAFWKYTLIPLLENFEQIVEVQFFRRFHLKEKGCFDLSMIPELQESEDEQSNRDIAEIQAGLKTINDVLRERGLPEKEWGDTWWKPAGVADVRQKV